MVFVPEPHADVYLMTRRADQAKKDSVSVLDAIDRIRQKHLPHLDIMARLQLRSSLLVETAATLYRRGRPFSASIYALAALFTYPTRNAAFFRTIWRSVRELFQS
jgi:hypothetical protein